MLFYHCISSLAHYIKICAHLSHPQPIHTLKYIILTWTHYTAYSLPAKPLAIQSIPILPYSLGALLQSSNQQFCCRQMPCIMTGDSPAVVVFQSGAVAQGSAVRAAARASGLAEWRLNTEHLYSALPLVGVTTTENTSSSRRLMWSTKPSGCDSVPSSVDTTVHPSNLNEATYSPSNPVVRTDHFMPKASRQNKSQCR